MPLRRIVEPALKLAREGVALNRLQAYIFDVVGPIYMETEGSRAIFESKTRPGRLVGEGEIVANPDFADLLENLVIEGADLFYRGEVAALIDAECRARGGTLTRADLEAYRMERREPLGIEYRGAHVFTNPPPSLGGLLIGFALELLKDVDPGAAGAGSIGYLGDLVRVMALTNEARVESGLHDSPPAEAAERLLGERMVDAYRTRVSGHPRAHRGTTHISVVDGDGNAASLTLSNGEGCGYVVPGTGVMLNNMLGEEDINPRGFHAWPTDTRMSSMMSPSLILGGGGRVTALGSGGSNRIRTAILQVLVNILDFGDALETAVIAPRVHFERDQLNIEPGFRPDVVRALGDAYPECREWDDLNLFFGGVHAVSADPAAESFDGAGDPRRGGVAINL